MREERMIIMKYECEIIQDLIPLYVDEICSEKSKEMVTEHIAECDVCSNMVTELKKSELTNQLSCEKGQVLSTHAKKERRRSTTVGLAFAGILMIPLIICLICNLATNHGLSWFFIVFTSLMIFASLTVVPLLVSKDRFLWATGAFLFSLTALLLTISILTHGDWFFIAVIPSVCGTLMLLLPIIMVKLPLTDQLKRHRALLGCFLETICLYAIIIVSGIYSKVPGYFQVSMPITCYCMILPYAIIVIANYIPIRRLQKGALISFVTGIHLAFINDVVDRSIGIIHKLSLQKRPDFKNWNLESNDANTGWLMIITGVVLTIIFLIIDLIKKAIQNKKAK